MTQARPGLIDLVILVPDRNTEAAIKGILGRSRSLGIRNITFEVFVHPERDPGCYNRRSHDFLRSMAGRYAHALVVFDKAGCGQESQERISIERNVEDNLRASGWGDRAAALVIDAELEAWVWTDSTHVPECLGWQGHMEDLRKWLDAKGLWPARSVKPPDPKRAMEQVLVEARKPRSSSIYLALAQRVSFQRCSDRAFRKLRLVLGKWFADTPDSSGSCSTDIHVLETG